MLGWNRPVRREERFLYSVTLDTPNGECAVEGPVPGHSLRGWRLHPGLTAFRPADRQLEALVNILSLPGGRCTVARQGATVVGYVAFHPPDAFERWSRGNRGDVLEFGIEVARPFRGHGIAGALLDVSFRDPEMERYIVLSTEYYWHWDTEGTGLSLMEYRTMLQRLFGRVGLEPRETDDEDIACHPANMMMVRVGRQVDPARAREFERLLVLGARGGLRS